MFQKKIFFIILLYVLGCFEVTAQNKPQQIGPPYPDVWGYDFSNLPSVKSGGTSISAFEMEDGDIWFVILKDDRQECSTPYVIKELDKEYLLVKFFKNEKISLSEKQWDEFSKKFSDKLIYYILYSGKKLSFSDGSTLEMGNEFFPEKQFSPPFYGRYLIKTDKENKIEKNCIFSIAPRTRIWRDREPGDDFLSSLFFYERIKIFSTFVSLKDDTFIVYSEGSGLILRFDKDLNTHFKPVNSVKIKGNIIPRNFFVIPYTLIEQFEATKSNNLLFEFQNIHDALLGYFALFTLNK